MGIGRPRDLEKQGFWEDELRAWQESGQTQAEFCRRRGLEINTFPTWKHWLGLRGQERAQDLGTADGGPEVSPVRLAPVTIRPEVEFSGFITGPAVGPAAPLTVVTGGGYRIEVGDGFAPDTLDGRRGRR